MVRMDRGDELLVGWASFLQGNHHTHLHVSNLSDTIGIIDYVNVYIVYNIYGDTVSRY